jgi:hypothetical protein
VSCQRIAYSLLLGVIAASSAQAGAYASANQRAADWLESQQDTSDGSWRDSSEARTYLQTAEAVLARHQANRRRAPSCCIRTGATPT